MTGRNAGPELIRRGWTQGSLLSAASVQIPYLAQRTSQGGCTVAGEPGGSVASIWEPRQLALDEGDYLVIVTQVCDLVRTPAQEPYVEAVRAFWTSDKAAIHQASTNSLRRFVLRRRTTADETVEALIADATVRVLIEKVALLTLEPEPGFDQADTVGPREFRKWLGERYARPPLPDNLVVAVQRPIVDAVRKLRPSDERLQVLEGIREILFVLQDDGPPYQVELWFLANEATEVPRPDEEAAARLAGWIAEVLDNSGQACLAHWELFDAGSLSVRDYITAYSLPLDDYTLTEELGRMP